MRLISLFIFPFVSLSFLFGDSDWPPEHNQNSAYTHESIVVTTEGDSYITLKDVPAGTPISSTAYWTLLSKTTPNIDPGDPPAADGPGSDEQVPNANPTEFPAFIESSVNIGVSEGHSDSVYIASAENADTYSISGDDASLFKIDETTGVITFISLPDYENPSDNNTDNNYSIIITATNDKGSAQLLLIITVIDDLNDNSQISLPGAGDASSLLLNISTAGYVSTDAKMSGGFIIVGNPMDVLVTAKSSKENDVDPLINPRLEVVPLARDKILGQNNDWRSASNVAEITATGFMNDSGDSDAAVLLTLEPGAYLADVFTEDSDSGGALVEVFDMNAINSTSGSKLLDISTNGTVLTGTLPGQKMTAGFIVFSGTNKRVLVTAKGSNESGVDPLNNPRLEVLPLARDKVSGSNNDWTSNDSTQVDAISAIGFMNGFKDTDAALILTLDAGAYLVDVFSEDNDSGKALVEVFDVDMLVNDFGIVID